MGSIRDKAKQLQLGTKVKKVIEAVVPKKYIPKDCNCGNREGWLNGLTKVERLKQMEEEKRRQNGF